MSRHRPIQICLVLRLDYTQKYLQIIVNGVIGWVHHRYSVNDQMARLTLLL